MRICPSCNRTNREKDSLYCAYCATPLPAEETKKSLTKEDIINTTNSSLGFLKNISDQSTYIIDNINLISANLKRISGFFGSDDFKSLGESWDTVSIDLKDELKELKSFVFNTKKDLLSLQKKHKLSNDAEEKLNAVNAVQKQLKDMSTIMSSGATCNPAMNTTFTQDKIIASQAKMKKKKKKITDRVDEIYMNETFYSLLDDDE